MLIPIKKQKRIKLQIESTTDHSASPMHQGGDRGYGSFGQ
ncbi:hypothetical protein GARC_4002 [Paraglaciecola arctica BSs20135]|uniref:Uncharacterized protein n=1 Tax=Paraglaciecola arctica BSs20135 TaxID=493475 RepID=K6XJW2_9ALTE|nr:hypothetical protein GARC_4002 [Paraglaciecola arctica BSs20135]